MLKNRKIFLVGFMGSGKTTLGKKLSKKLGSPFFDLDEEVEKHGKLSVSELFKQYGELYFRDLEKNVLRNISENEGGFVFSVGGGTPCFHSNIDYMNSVGIAIYLKYNAGILTSRLLQAKNERPLIKGLNAEELKCFVEEKLGERELYYNKSSIVIEKPSLKAEDIEKFLLC